MGRAQDQKLLALLVGWLLSSITVTYGQRHRHQVQQFVSHQELSLTLPLYLRSYSKLLCF
jgi:hypothetical protein